MIREGNANDVETVHALEMGFIFQVLLRKTTQELIQGKKEQIIQAKSQ